MGRTDLEALTETASLRALAADLTRRKREVLRTGRPVRFDATFLIDDREVTRDVMLVPIVGPDGRTAGITGVAVDVTDRRLLADGLQRANERLIEAERIARMGSFERILATGETHWSPGLFELFGLDPRTTAPSFEAYIETIHPDDRGFVLSALEAAADGGGAFEFENRIILPDGRIRWMHGRGEFHVGRDGRAVRVTGANRDVTEEHLERSRRPRTSAGRTPARAAGNPALRRALTPRQYEILELAAHGLTNAEIGERLTLSPSTVKWHVRQILRVLGLPTRAAAVARYAGLEQEPGRR